MLLGPMLARFGVGYIPKPGGDKIGRRRLDTHFIGFQKLGATLDFDTAAACSEVRCKELKGCYMLLDEASVTGTANIIMAAVMAKGFTTIYNAACEPYIQQLCLMLNRMGARISGIASNLLTIEGVRELHGTEHAAARHDRGRQLHRSGSHDPFGADDPQRFVREPRHHPRPSSPVWASASNSTATTSTFPNRSTTASRTSWTARS